jgi:hypothetical protein
LFWSDKDGKEWDEDEIDDLKRLLSIDRSGGAALDRLSDNAEIDTDLKMTGA